MLYHIIVYHSIVYHTIVCYNGLRYNILCYVILALTWSRRASILTRSSGCGGGVCSFTQLMEMKTSTQVYSFLPRV